MKCTKLQCILLGLFLACSCRISLAADATHEGLAKIEHFTSVLGLAVYHDQTVYRYNEFVKQFGRFSRTHRKLVNSAHIKVNLLKNTAWRAEALMNLKALGASAEKLTITPDPSPQSTVLNVRMKELADEAVGFTGCYEFMMNHDASNMQTAMDLFEQVIQLAGIVAKENKYLSGLISGKTKLPGAPSAGTLVAFHIDNKLYVQRPMQMDTYLATDAQHKAWKGSHKPFSLVSSDGLYRFVFTTTEDHFGDALIYKIFTAKSNKLVTTSKALRDDGGLRFCFDGWLPGTHCIRMVYNDHCSTNESYSWPIMSVDKRRIIPFNGWLSPNRKWAIVPDANGVVSDGYFHSSGAAEISRGDRNMYVVPMTTDIYHYRFRPKMGKRIMVDGRGKLFPSDFIGGYGSEIEPGARRSLVVFSRDSHYAICGRQYLVDLYTGNATKLPGDEAFFIK